MHNRLILRCSASMQDVRQGSRLEVNLYIHIMSLKQNIYL